MKIRSLAIAGLSVISTVAGFAGTISETFANDPLQHGWQIFGDTNLFTWNATNQNVEVTWDSTRPNSYYYLPLGTALTRDDTFTVSFDLRLDDITAFNNGQQIAIGLLNFLEATNAAFSRFVAATGYRTVAERPLDPARYAQLSAAQRRPASLVFVGAKAARSDDPAQWWRVIPGADWRHPEGPRSSIRGKDAWPVVHIAWEDAMAYARWLGRDLPTEAEWEYAARGGLAGKRYAWGDRPQDPSHPMANTWQGVFPVRDLGTDGFKASPAPVGCFPPNGYGLFDMIGNVWEWATDWYEPGHKFADGDVDPTGPAKMTKTVGGPLHVIKGGSWLCADNFCARYRPAARQPEEADLGASHIGFRTILKAPGPSPTKPAGDKPADKPAAKPN